MTIRIIEFDPHTASDELWAAFNETLRVIAHWPDEPILDDAETRREVQTTNPMVEFRRWGAMEGDEVAAPFEPRSADPVRRTRKTMPGSCGQAAASGQARGGAVQALCCSARCTN